MTTQLLDELLHELPARQKTSFLTHYRALQQLPSADLDLQEFLDEFLVGIASLYAATAAAVWFKNPDETQLERKASVGYEALGLSDELQSAHERLLRFGLAQTKAFLVQPFSAPQPQAEASNPTDSFVILGPIVHQGSALALVELFLGPVPYRGGTALVRAKYGEWLEYLIGILCRGIERRFLTSGETTQAALRSLDAAAEEAERHQEEIRKRLERTLHALVGKNFGTLTANQAVAGRVHQVLESKGLRVRCPECGSAAILRCQGAGNSKTGVFLFDHYLETGRTFHGGPTTFPWVTLVAKPPRRKRA